MMWPSQNFLLYNGTIVKIKIIEWVNNLKNMLRQPPPLWRYIQQVQIIKFSFKKKKANGFDTS